MNIRSSEVLQERKFAKAKFKDLLHFIISRTRATQKDLARFFGYSESQMSGLFNDEKAPESPGTITAVYLLARSVARNDDDFRHELASLGFNAAQPIPSGAHAPTSGLAAMGIEPEEDDPPAKKTRRASSRRKTRSSTSGPANHPKNKNE